MRVLMAIITLCVSWQMLCQDWSYVRIDSAKQKWGNWAEPSWLRYFGLDAGDVNGDGYADILSGRYIYHHPGNTKDSWRRIVLDDNVDGIFIMDVDGDAYADLIAQALPDVYWYEAINANGTRYTRRKIAEIPATSHVNSQGFERSQLIPGGKEEILLAGNGNVYMIKVPEDLSGKDLWPNQLIAENTSDEGIGIGDIDGDGDLDIACGRRPADQEEPLLLVWFQNNGEKNKKWTDHVIGRTEHPIDRIEIGDLTGNGKTEIVLTEERYPGLEPDAQLYWFEQLEDPMKKWEARKLATQFSTNNLDLGDVDQDGDLDILTAEHKGTKLELQLWQNDGRGSFSKKILDSGKENHLGAQLADMDGDGDLDIIGAGWDQHQFVHLWINPEHKTQNPKLQTQNNIPQYQKPESTITTNNYDTISAFYQGREHYIIYTSSVTYYYDKAGGGFSRLIDGNGNDWISYKYEPDAEYPAGAASHFRGLPNLVFQGDDNGAGHPGFDQCRSWFENDQLYSETLSGKWRWRWSFFENHARLDILKSDPGRAYWFLYEGTPAGKFKPDGYYYGTNAGGPYKSPPDFYLEQAKFNALTWAYVGSDKDKTVFFMLHDTSEAETGIISYLGNSVKGVQSEDGMTVFGFGRGEGTQPLLKGLNSFVIGLHQGNIQNEADHQNFKQKIDLLISKKP